jgi:hypothetical protein
MDTDPVENYEILPIGENGDLKSFKSLPHNSTLMLGDLSKHSKPFVGPTTRPSPPSFFDINLTLTSKKRPRIGFPST